MRTPVSIIPTRKIFRWFVFLFPLLSPPGLVLSNARAVAVYNIRDYGAVGDGITIDTAAIQSAIDAAESNGGEVYVPAGTYVSGPLFVPSQARIYGDGYTSVLSQIASTPSHLLSPKYRATIPSVRDVLIRDLRLLGNSALQNDGGPMPGPHLAKHGIAILGGENWTVTRVWAEDFDGDGIYLGRNFENAANAIARSNIVEEATVRRNIRNGMMISHGEYNTIRASLFEENQIGVVPSSPKYSPSVYASAELDIEPNNFNFIEKAIFNNVEGNTFRNGNNIGIQMTRSVQIEDNRIVGNTFTDNKKSAITIFSSTTRRTLIEGNFFEATSPDKVWNYIRIVRGPDNIVVNNTFRGGIVSVASSRPITFDAQTNTLANSTFTGNDVDFTGGTGDGAAIFFTSGTVSNYIFGNTLTNAHFDMRGSLGANLAPFTTITSPSPNAHFLSPATFLASASAEDSDGAIQYVEFSLNGLPLSTATSSPYETEIENLLSGSYALSARTVDDHYYFSDAEVQFTVSDPVWPNVSLTSPVSGSLFTYPESVDFVATASDADGTVMRVEFRNGSQIIGSDDTPPYTCSWPAPVGTSTVFARAIDNDGLSADSALVTIIMQPPVPVTVASEPFASSSWSGGAGWEAGWTHSGDSAIVTTEGPYDAPCHCRLRRGNGFISRPLNLAGYASATLAVAIKASSFEKTESANIMARAGANPWVILKTFTNTAADDLYHVYSFSLTPFVGGPVTIAFDAQMKDPSDRFFVDTIRIDAVPN